MKSDTDTQSQNIQLQCDQVQNDLTLKETRRLVESLDQKIERNESWVNFMSRREKEIQNRHNARVKQIQEKLYPNFPKEQEYDVIYIDPPWKYDKNTQLSNVPEYNTLGFNQLSYLPIRRIAKENCLFLIWTTGPMIDRALSLIKLFGFRYVTVFQNWIKLQSGEPAKIKSSYSDASSEFLLWAEKGRTQQLRTPDVVPQILSSEITRHSEKPHDQVFKRLMLKIHLNKLKCLEIFAREKRMKYFDGYGDELEPQFQLYQPSKLSQDCANITLEDNILEQELNNKRVDEIMSKIQYEIKEFIMRNIIKDHSQAFALSKGEIGKTPIAKHHIRMKDGSVPVRHNAYRCSPKEKEFMEKELKLLEILGCIERCEATWVMPVIMVKKKDTADLRMCIDYRSLNKEMIIENYPIPRVDDILSLLGKYSIFSKLDIKSGFWQIEIDENSQQYTGFITPVGTFKWKRMPFGLKNAPATFQRVIEEALRPVLGKICTVYIDDIIIFSNIQEEHVKSIHTVLNLLEKADLKIGVDKCEFFQKHIDILGHHIANGQVTPQISKIQTIMDIPQPQNRSQVRSFVGMCSYYRVFIQHFSQKCEPLLKLTRQRSDFDWTPEVEASFQLMKKELCTAPMLATPVNDGIYILHTDFSELGLGAVLSQKLPNEETPRVIEYASRCLRGAEVNYPAYEGEVLAVHWALEKFRHYLHGVEFKLYTDNKALSQVLTSSTKSKKIIRWIMEMQEYNFTAEHRSGKDNANADALSRLIKIPDEIGVKLNNQVNFISTQTYLQMHPGDRFNEEVQISLNYLSEGVGDLHCKICQSTHTKVPMLICECCGQGFHTSCMSWSKDKPIPKEAWYCEECLKRNSNLKVKDITMDFEVIDQLKGVLDISNIEETRLQSIKIRASQFQWRYNRIYYVRNGQFLLVPTIAERKLLVLEQHRVLLHPSVDKLVSILKQNFYWSNMEGIAQEVTYDCQVCQARKHLSLPSTTYIPTDKGHHPFHTVSMDLAPELTITTNKNRHLLVIVDNFSKYVILIPLKDKSSQSVATVIFNHLICIFGTPKCIRVDQGSEFKGDVEHMAHRWGISMARATTYHPQANGMAERMIGVVKTAITAAINDPEQPLPWDEACYPIQMSINAATSRATSLSPYMVVFGRAMAVPQAIVYDVPLEQFQEPDELQLEKYMKKFLKFLKSYQKIATEKRKQVDSFNKQQYEKLALRKSNTFQENQLVFIKRANTSRWALPNIGPFIFIKYTSDTKKVAIVKNPATNIISKQSVQNLSPWKLIQNIDEQDEQV